MFKWFKVYIILLFFYSNANICRENPQKYIRAALKIFNKNKGKIIVELGSMRSNLNHHIDTEICPLCSDGHSTFLWAQSNAKVYSVDINPEATKIAYENCKQFNVFAITFDAIEFLKLFNQKIDLLFLDAWDAIEGTDYAEKHLEAYLTAKKNLHQQSLILIDDTDILEGGKGKLVIPQALKDGYKILFTGRQTLLSRYFLKLEL